MFSVLGQHPTYLKSNMERLTILFLVAAAVGFFCFFRYQELNKERYVMNFFQKNGK